jgi:hypothetical protein
MADNSSKESGGAEATVTGRERSARVKPDENALPLLMEGQVPGITRVRRRARMTEAAPQEPGVAEATDSEGSELDQDSMPLLMDGLVPGLTRVREQTEMDAEAPQELVAATAPQDIAEEISGDELFEMVRDTSESLATGAEDADPLEWDPQDEPSELTSEHDVLPAEDGEAAEIELDELGYSADDGQFLTSEELQSLSVVLGDPSDSSEPLYEDGSMDGTSNWNAVQSEFRGLRDTIQDLHERSLDLETLKPMLAAIKAEVEVSHDRGDELSSSLDSLSGDMRQIHQNLHAASKAAVESAMSVREIHVEMTRHPVVVAVRDRRAMEQPLVMAGCAVLMLSWAAAFYWKTGDLRLALFGLVAANIAGCAAIFLSRTGR